MIFRFLTQNRAGTEAALSFAKLLSRTKPEDADLLTPVLDHDDAETLLRLLPLPPHMLSLEDMVFCRNAIEKLWTEGPGKDHQVSVDMAREINIEDQNKRCVYWLPHAKGSQTATGRASPPGIVLH